MSEAITLLHKLETSEMTLDELTSLEKHIKNILANVKIKQITMKRMID